MGCHPLLIIPFHPSQVATRLFKIPSKFQVFGAQVLRLQVLRFELSVMYVDM